MNAKSTAASLTAATFPAAVIIGAGLVTSTINGLQTQRDHYRALAAQPHPTATVTQVATTPAPQPTPRATATLLAARPVALRPQSQPQPPGTPRQGGNDDGMTAEQTPSRAAPNPPAASPSQCAGRIAAVQLPLGVLPDCLITLGGSR